MLFLLVYDREGGKVVSNRTFIDAERKAAEEARLDLEMQLNRQGLHHEVVLLEALSEHALQSTHSRYFKDLAGLARSSATSTGSAWTHVEHR